MKKQKITSQPKSESKKILIFAVILAVIFISGVWYVLRSSDSSSKDAIPIAKEGYQEVRMAVVGLDYVPSTLPIVSGQKVRWVIDATRAQGCARALYSPELGINTVLKSGENVLEFIPPRTGTIRFTCTMGMTDGRFEVA